MYFAKFNNDRQGMLEARPNRYRGWVFYIGTRRIKYERRDGGPGTMGRFGGGWEVKLGVQASSLRNLLTLRSAIFNLGVASLRFTLQDEYDSEAKARALAIKTEAPA